MILALLLLAAAAPQSAADAEAAFNRAAQKDGQWTAFRAFADPEAIMFSPGPVNVLAKLKDANDPAISVQWWAARSYVSCDNGHAVNTGSWVRPHSFGYFTTLWARQPDGAWNFRIDGGDKLAAPRAVGDKPRIVRASCKGSPSTVPAVRYAGGDTGEGVSEDRTLAWRWHVAPDNSRTLDVWLWDGRQMRSVISDRVAGQ